MPQRAYFLVEMILGSVAVVFLLIMGANVYRASTKGSPWRQRVLGAGVFAMILLGFLPDAFAAEPAEKRAAPPAERREDPGLEKALQKILVQRPGWKKIDGLRREVLRIFEGKKSFRDYDWTGRQRLRDRLDEAGRKLAEWNAEAMLTPMETGFLAHDVSFLADVLFRRQVAESAASAGVRPGGSRRGPGSFEYLQGCLPALEALCTQERSHTPVLREIIRILEFHLRNLSEYRISMCLSRVDHGRAREVRARVKGLVGRLRERRKSALATHPLWSRFLTLWKQAELHGAGRDLPRPFERKHKDAILNRLGDGPKLLDALVRVKRLSLAEAGLLKVEFEMDVKKVRDLPVKTRILYGLFPPMNREEGTRVREEIEAGKIRGGRGSAASLSPTCYSPCPTPGHSYPVESLRAIRERLPLLERLAFQDRLHSEVLERVLGTVEHHLARLARARPASPLGAQAHGEIEVLIDRVKNLLIRIKAR
ncbi:MAG: hypothetical protein ACYTFG_04260 [Planctomycetota bacterium]|jgi:hypothetical protein